VTGGGGRLTGGRTDPRDTLVVGGGRPLDRVDADAIARAAVRLGDAAAALRAAAFGCSTASADLDRSLWAPAAFDTAGPAALAVRRQAVGLAADAARRLHERAAVCDRTGERLLRAAGLYVQAESAAEQLVAGVVGVGAAAVAFGVTALAQLPAVAPWARIVGGAGVLVAARSGASAASPPAGPGLDGAAPPVCTPTPAGLGPAATRLLAPYADEAVAGLGFGVSAGAPGRSRLDLSVTGGARVLSSVVHELLQRAQVRVLEMPDASFTAGRPAWADEPSATVAEALARTADLYPWGSGVLGRPTPGTPAGTVAVERVEHADGSVSWTVLVPGTQGLVSLKHPFDGVTDLDLMAKAAADVTAAVADALDHAGARPTEPVVLVGHSLGGIAAMALASSPGFLARHRLGGVVTAGAPTATFTSPPGVPVLHLENDEELVSPLDGRSTAENPATADRVTVGRALLESAHPADLAASGSVVAAHSVATHLRTLDLARTSGSAQVADVVGRVDRLLAGERSSTRFYAARRDPGGGRPVVMAPGAASVNPSSSGRTLR
jgi:hypothetical protein